MCLLPICSKQGKHRDGGEELEKMRRGRGGRARIQPELRGLLLSDFLSRIKTWTTSRCPTGPKLQSKTYGVAFRSFNLFSGSFSSRLSCMQRSNAENRETWKEKDNNKAGEGRSCLCVRVLWRGQPPLLSLCLAAAWRTSHVHPRAAPGSRTYVKLKVVSQNVLQAQT